MIEFHPIVWMFDFNGSEPHLRYRYNSDEVIYDEYQGTYTNPNASLTSKEFRWNHGLAKVVNALLKAGLQIDVLNEYDEAPYNCLPGMKQTKSEMFVLDKFNRLFPLLYEIKATKK